MIVFCGMHVEKQPLGRLLLSQPFIGKQSPAGLSYCAAAAATSVLLNCQKIAS